MHKVINGKSYNTETAREIASDSPDGFAVNDFHYYSETLYCKRTGEYFLLGEGNAASKYAEPYGNSGWVGGSRIMPLTYSEATAWAEEHMTADEYESEFGEVVEDDEMVRMNLSIPQSTADKLKRGASERGISLGEMVSQLADSLRK